MFAILIAVISAFIPRISVGQQTAEAFVRPEPQDVSVFTMENIHLNDSFTSETKPQIIIVEGFESESGLCPIKSGDTIQVLSGEFQKNYEHKESSMERVVIYFRGTVSNNHCKGLAENPSFQGTQAVPSDFASCRSVKPECESAERGIEITIPDYLTPLFHDVQTFVPPWREGDEITLMEKETYAIYRNSRYQVFTAGSDIDEDMISNGKPFPVFFPRDSEMETRSCAIKSGERVKITFGNVFHEGSFWKKELVFVGQVRKENGLNRCRHLNQEVKIILPDHLTAELFGFSRWNPLEKHSLFVESPKLLP